MSKCVCSLSSESGSSVSGVLTLAQTSMEASTVTITGEIKGLAPGQHGLSLHTYGDLNLTDNPMYHPFGATPHGLPEDGTGNHKIGSLGNITADESGKAIVEMTCTDSISIYGPHSVVGRLVAVYAAQDDGGRGGHDNSLTTGNAGPRVAAGVVGLSK